MKKRVAIILLVLLVVVASVQYGRAITGYTVGAIVATSAIIAGGSVLIPGLINGPSGKSGWYSLAVSVANASALAAKISLANIAAGGTAVKNALLGFSSQSKGPTKVQNGQVGYNTNVYPLPAGGWTSPYNPSLFKGYTTTTSGAYNELLALCPSPNNNGAPYACTTTPQGYSCRVIQCNLGGSWVHWYKLVGESTVPEVTFTPYNDTDLSSEISAAVTAGNQEAGNLIKAALVELNENMQGNSSSLGSTLTNEGKTMLNNAVTQSQANQVDGLVPKTPEELANETGAAAATAAAMYAAVRAALAAQGLSSGEILEQIKAALALYPGLTQSQVQSAMAAALAGVAPNLTAAQVQTAVAAALQEKGVTAAGVETAVKAALNDATGVIEPTETETILPEKLSLTAVMNTFMTSINALPGLATLRGLGVTCGGSSVLCMTFLGVQGCYDVAQVPGLDAIGNSLFGIVSLVSFIGIFRG